MEEVINVCIKAAEQRKCLLQQESYNDGQVQRKLSGTQGYIFDCSDYKQVDKYVTIIMHIAEYVSAEYKQIQLTIKHEMLFIILTPIPLTNNPPTNWDRMLFKMKSGVICQEKKHIA